MFIRPRVGFVVLVLAAAFWLLAAPGGTPLPTSPARVAATATGTATATADQRRPTQTSLDVALTGTATADTTATGSPASNAIDGSASTDWCATQWTGALTVDLGRVRTLDGLGITLGDDATTALVNFSAGDDPNDLGPVPNATKQSVPAAEPASWP